MHVNVMRQQTGNILNQIKSQTSKKINLFKLSKTKGINNFNNASLPIYNNISDIIDSTKTTLYTKLIQSNAIKNKYYKFRENWYLNRLTKHKLPTNNNIVINNSIINNLINNIKINDITLKHNWIDFIRHNLIPLGNVSINNTLNIFNDGDSFFEELWMDISNAKNEILFETYIMEPDYVALKTIDMLTEAANKGVKVVLIIDGFGCNKMNSKHFEKLKQAGGVVLTYNETSLAKAFEIFVEKWSLPFVFWYRNHKKIIIIDDKMAYTGGMNVTNEYLSKSQNGGINKFRDTHCKLIGDGISHLKNSICYSILDINPFIPENYKLYDDDTINDTQLDEHNSTYHPNVHENITSDTLINFRNTINFERIKKNIHILPPKKVSLKQKFKDIKNVFRYTDQNRTAMSKYSDMEIIDSNDYVDNELITDGTHGSYVQVLESYRDDRLKLIQKALIKSINNSSSHIYIINPYYLPPKRFKKALINAAKRGCDVKIITTNLFKSDVPFISLASRNIYGELLDNGIKIYEYNTKNLHAKSVLIDDIVVSLGSFNFDDWSNKKNLEVNLMVIDSKVCNDVKNTFIDELTNNSIEVKAHDVKRRDIISKFVYWSCYSIARLASRLL